MQCSCQFKISSIGVYLSFRESYLFFNMGVRFSRVVRDVNLTFELFRLNLPDVFEELVVGVYLHLHGSLVLINGLQNGLKLDEVGDTITFAHKGALV